LLQRRGSEPPTWPVGLFKHQPRTRQIDHGEPLFWAVVKHLKARDLTIELEETDRLVTSSSGMTRGTGDIV
jgi:hypothetical protein